MKLKKGVNSKNVHPVLWMFISVIAGLHKAWTGKEMVITSLRRTGRTGLHPKGMAFDIRRWYLDAAGKMREYYSAASFCEMLQHRFGRCLGIVLEPEWLTPAQIKARGGIKKIAPHIHVQLKKTTWPGVL